MKRALKQAGFRVFKSLGLFELCAASRWRQNRLAILCYHGVSIEDEHEWDRALYVTADLFEQRLRLLRQLRYNVLPLDEAVRRLQQGNLPSRSVSITFDDGGSDFFQRARPLLKKYEVPATVYLTTFYCRQDRPVFKLFCSYLLWKARARSAGHLMDLPGVFDLSSPTGRALAQSAIERHVADNHLSLPQRHAFAERLAAELGQDYRDLLGKRILQLMTPDEVRQVTADGIAVQLHTHRHRTPLDRDLFIREISDNRCEIQRMTGINPTHFCYPSGVYRPEFLPWLREQGVVSATTCESGLATSATDPLLLPRIVDDAQVSVAQLESSLAGVTVLSGVSLRRYLRASPEE
jgi:peptidoglycan/xylan/chitin deacetylase (PgdA/CDA1 family)